MKFEILNENSPSKYYDDILKLLYISDSEFIPPLSARNSTTQSDFSKNSGCNDGIDKYFENLKNQQIMVAIEDEKVTAFVSYRKNHVCKEISESLLPNIYISTLVVNPNFRGRNLTRIMYGYLFDEYKDFNITTRTWSTNYAHIKILTGFGFRVLETLKNDRGEGIDTVYFVKDKKC